MRQAKCPMCLKVFETDKANKIYCGQPCKWRWELGERRVRKQLTVTRDLIIATEPPAGGVRGTG